MMGMRYDGSSDDEHNMYDDLFYNFPFNAGGGGQKPKDKEKKPQQSFIIRKFREWFKRDKNEEN